MSDQTPFNERWGGWYVTGTHGTQLHRGNAVFPYGIPAGGRLNLAPGANVTTLDDRIDTSQYLSGHSDIVALIALTHQTRIHNLITRANYETQFAMRNDEQVSSADTAERIRAAVEPLVRGMFFVNEAPLTEPVRGTTEFAAEFEKSGIRDSKGRSLKDLDLNRRFLRYPLSYLIYSPGFDGLPEPAKEVFYARVRTILDGSDTVNFAHLTAEDRAALREILLDTKPEFARFARQ